MPPIRCSNPGVPGIAQGRASVFSSRTKGRKGPSLDCGWRTLILGSFEISGSFHGSEPFARYPSDRKKTGVMYFTASRTASITKSKQLEGVEDATIATGESPFLPI